MRDKLRHAQKTLHDVPKAFSGPDADEYVAFLEYLYRDNFTLLGYREYAFSERGGAITSRIAPGMSLGLFRDEDKPVFLTGRKEGLPADLQSMRRMQPPVMISKVNRRSTVHRAVPMDAVAVKKYDAKGKVVGEYLFVGLFTSVTYSRSIQDVPLLRQKADAVLLHSGYLPGSHNFKALRHVLEKFPRDELFQMTPADLEATASSIVRLQERHRIALYARKDPFRRYISCLVYIPRDRYGSRTRKKIRDILQNALGGTCTDIQTNLDDSNVARVIYRIETDQMKPAPAIDTKKIESLLQEAGRTYRDRLAYALAEGGRDDTDIPEIVHSFGDSFPETYTEATPAKQAVYDIAKMRDAVRDNGVALELYCDDSCGPHDLKLKLYQPGKPVILSDVLPVLENLGLRVLSEMPFEIRPQGGNVLWIHDFTMTIAAPTDLKRAKPIFEETLLRLSRGEAENDSLNQLTLTAFMDWREIMILRAYVRYLKQTNSPFSTAYVEKTLCGHADVARLLVNLFKTLFDPDANTKAETALAKFDTALAAALDKVTSLDEDRILRALAGLVRASLRTNFYQMDESGAPKAYLSIKLDSKQIEGLPEPKPFREIWVYAPRVEGIHLRADLIARGGIRWSDRNEDFRTEILGLMKAQQVKNSIIVPMGAKGGFVVKRPPPPGAGRPAFQQEGIECYKTLVRGLLDITDNRVGTSVVPPKDVVRRDGDDPYLVVAADKGTATFSDIANSLSADYNFWLGDAFASGGSAGYDHKKIGITARGAWESVKRHFREMGHDTQTQPFDVIGVGDMAGDVFGNGMIMSDQIRMVGAFNHVHIFCDPTPDPAKTFIERKRMFDAVKGWDDYDTKLLSKGGRIYSRADKSLELTPEIRARFGIEQAKVAPSDLIQAMLRTPCDLLYFGGIGTYMKASSESHADVGDKVNDALRVNANEIKAKVIGEGANLAVTQTARIEYAKKGGRLNADFIDNSGGVNCSDVEVNIKILFGDILSNPKHSLTVAKRNALLARMTDEVAGLVLRNNYQQTQGISLMEYSAAEQLPVHARLIDELERNYGFSRKQSGVPDAEEITARQKAGKGLTRPELAILQAHAKILYTSDLLATDIPDLPEMEGRWLFTYFPLPLRLKYETEIRRHRLRRQIIATTLISDIVGRMGPVFIKSMMDKAACGVADVVRAFEVVRDAFELDLLWRQIEDLDNKVSAEIGLRGMRAIAQMAERETLWFLTRLGRRIDISKDVKAYRQGITSLRAVIDQVVTPDIAKVLSERIAVGVAENLPEDLARRIAASAPLAAACDITRISLAEDADIAATAKVYFALGAHFHLHWLRQRARGLALDGRFASEAVSSLIETFYNTQAALTAQILQKMKKQLRGNDAAALVAAWIAAQGPAAAALEQFFAELHRSETIDMSALVLAEQRLRQIA